jgi:hypothetical protein
MGSRSVVAGTTTAYKASTRNHAPNSLINKLKMIAAHEKNRVLTGMICTDPTSASTQGAGVGNTDWNVDLEGGIVVVNGVVKEFADAADYDVHSGSMYTDLHAGDSAIAVLVAKNVAGTVTLEVVKGTPAVTPGQVAPNDAAITAQIGAGNTWIRIADLNIDRTADAVVAQTQNNTTRPVLGVNNDTGIDTY